jgi:hypothetical protein
MNEPVWKRLLRSDLFWRGTIIGCLIDMMLRGWRVIYSAPDALKSPRLTLAHISSFPNVPVNDLA